MTLKVQCTIEPTKNPKWARLAPVERGAVAPLTIKASDVPAGKKTATVTVTF